jgi:hypothetical protein
MGSLSDHSQDLVTSMAETGLLMHLSGNDTRMEGFAVEGEQVEVYSWSFRLREDRSTCWVFRNDVCNPEATDPAVYKSMSPNVGNPVHVEKLQRTAESN